MKEQVRERGIELVKFASHIEAGLSGREKRISSKYLYNAEGSRLFEEIMDLPEYYPTKCELEILQTYKREILELTSSQEEIYLVDLGAGNGLKSMVLLNYFKGRMKLKYVPVDISQSALDDLEEKVRSKYAGLECESIHGEYLEALTALKERKHVRKLVLFLGSNIGNFTFGEALDFLKDLHDALNPDDLVLMGFDVKKNPPTIRAAYNDSRGVTAKFNLNLLKRINEELGGNFNLDNFIFYPTYDPSTGEMKSFLVSKTTQEVFIKALDKSFHFYPWDSIQTECSNKYDSLMIQQLADHAGFEIQGNFYDSRKYFLDSMWRVI